MHANYSYNPWPQNDNDFWQTLINNVIAFILAIVIAFILHVCMASCSRKVTNTLETDTHDETETVSTSTQTTHSDISIDYASISRMFSEQQSWYNAHIFRRSYAYDSLGNQMVTNDEEISIGAHFDSHDSAVVDDNSVTNINITDIDISADSTRTKSDTRTVTEYVYQIPSLWRYSAYIGWICMAVGFGFISARLFRSFFHKF